MLKQPCIFDPLPLEFHCYIVKLLFIRVYSIIYFFPLQHMVCWFSQKPSNETALTSVPIIYAFRPVSTSTQNLYFKAVNCIFCLYYVCLRICYLNFSAFCFDASVPVPCRSLLFTLIYQVNHYKAATYGPRCEKTGLRGFRPGPTLTGLHSHRKWLEA